MEMFFQSILDYLNSFIINGSILLPFILLIAGILTSLMPCSLPVLPVILAYLSSSKKDSKGSFLIAVFYSLGLITVMIIFGLLASFLGKIFNQQSSLFQIIIGILLILMAIQSWGFYTFIRPRASKASNKSGLLGAYFTGLLMGVFSSPCSTPIIISLMGIVSTSASILKAVILFLIYGIGQSLLVLFAAVFVGKINELIVSDQYRKYSVYIQKAFAIVLFIVGIIFIYQGL